MKPFPIVASTFWWSALTIFAFAYAAYISLVAVSLREGLILTALILAALLFLTLSILWFLRSYWQGQDWTRTFVIIGLILKALYYLREAGPFNGHAVGGFFSYMRVVDLVFSIYIFGWLLTKEARWFFAFSTQNELTPK
jgi:hypothetical protein